MKYSSILNWLFLGCFLLLIACQNNQAPQTTEDATTSDSSKVVISSEASDLSKNKFETLDNLDLNSMKKVSSTSLEEGDCSSQKSIYKNGENMLVIDSVDCGDYGRTYYHYLLNEKDELQIVHIKELTPVVEEENGDYQFYYAISQHIIDFENPASPQMKAVVDTLSRNTPETKVQLDENFDQSNPWIILNEKGDDFLFGEKINYDGNWYMISKNNIKERLMGMTILPAQIPMKSNGTVGMGHRSEFRSMREEAIAEVVSNKEYYLNEKVDHFSRVTKFFEAATLPEDYLKLAYWKGLMEN